MAYDPVEIGYRKSPASVVTYDFLDIAEGIGVLTLLGCRVAVDTTPANDDHIFTTNSGLVTMGTVTLTDATDTDIDVTFRETKTVEGNMYFSIPIHLNGNSPSRTMSLALNKYSGSTETAIVAATQCTNVQHSGDTNTYHEINLVLPVPNTTFKAGDILRVTVTCTSNDVGGGFLQLNPAGNGNAGFTGTGGSFKAFVPILLDV